MKYLPTIVGAVLGVGVLLLFSGNYNGKQDAIDASIQLGDFCSATVIDDPDLSDGVQSTILTAKHCVKNKALGELFDVTLKKYDHGYTILEQTFKFELMSMSKESDLAILQTYSTEFWVKPIQVSAYDLDIGDVVYGIGYPLGLTQTITQGFAGPIEIIPNDADSESDDYRRSTALITNGNSGGGLFRDENGTWRLTGVCSISYASPNATAFITGWVPFTEIKSYLDSLEGVLSKDKDIRAHEDALIANLPWNQ